MIEANPVADRIDKLHDQWARFAGSAEARLLVWQATPDEAALIDAFVARECEAELAETPDLFLELVTPFARPEGHALALTKELLARHADAAAGLEDERHESSWAAPKFDARQDEVHILLSTLLSLLRHYQSETTPSLLVLLLAPSEVASFDAYQRWLQQLVRTAPPELRLIVVDDASTSAYAPLIDAEPARVLAVPCALDTAPVLERLAAQAGENTPGDRLRLLQTALGAAVGTGDMPTTLSLSAAAVELAVEQGWLHLAAAVQMTLAAAHVIQGQHTAALAAYTAADALAADYEASELARAAEDASAPSAGRKLRLQAQLGRAAVLLSSKSYERAGEAYVATAALAQAIPDVRAELDGYRLASYCYLQHADPGRAWDTGSKGLEIGLTMDEETRKTSTFCQLAAQLADITVTQRTYSVHRKPLEKQLAQSLGADWRAQLDAVAAS